MPSAQVGALVLINSDDGEFLLGPCSRRLLEVLYDGKPEASGDVAAAATCNKAEILEARKSLEFPPQPTVNAGLAVRYVSPELGQIAVRRGKDLVFDFGSAGDHNAEVTVPLG